MRKSVDFPITMSDLSSGERWRTTFQQFAADNEEDTDAVAAVRALRPGDAIEFGGGAAPLVRVRRVKPRTKTPARRR
jgi:hypothetical protein